MGNFLIFVYLLIAGLAQAAVVPSGIPQIGIGGSTSAGTSLAGPPAVIQNDVTKYYSAVCGLGNANVTTGNYYRCFKQGGTSGSDWTIASNKTAYCPGYYVTTNALGGTTAVGFKMGYGTGAVTNDNSSDPTGVVKYNATGYISAGGANSYGQNVWVPTPVYFSGSEASASIKPWINAQSSSVLLVVTFVCTEL